jgi:hypothetical protein
MDSDQRSVGHHLERLLDAVRLVRSRRGRADRRRPGKILVPDRHHESESAGADAVGRRDQT